MRNARMILSSKNIDIIQEYLAIGSEIGFVPTAWEVYSDAYFVREDREKLSLMGYKIIDLDITNYSIQILSEKLNSLDAIFVAWGNVFYLMQQLRWKEFDKLLIQFIDSWKLYIGASAGAAIVGPSLEPLITLDDPSMASNLRSLEGLNLFDRIILPHYGKKKYEEKYQEIFRKYGERYSLLPIKDNQAVVVSKANEFLTVMT